MFVMTENIMKRPVCQIRKQYLEFRWKINYGTFSELHAHYQGNHTKGAMQAKIMEEMGNLVLILVGNVEGNTQFRMHKWRCSDYNEI